MKHAVLQKILGQIHYFLFTGRKRQENMTVIDSGRGGYKEN